MSRPDLILMHPPCVFNFRESPVFLGPISDVVPSTSIFEIYPIGFLTISEHLQGHGMKVRIVNLALKMLRSGSFRPEEFIKKLDPVAFGIDLHWLPHADGSLSLAELIKKVHPQTPVVFGGFSATYFREEIMRDYPAVDFIVCGDSTEEPVRRLIEAIRSGGGYKSVPNLVWRDKKGETIFNGMSFSPDDLDYARFDYGHLLKMSLRDRDPSGYIPFKYWPRYPVTAVFSCRGCYHNCGSCGGALTACNRISSRERPRFRSPEILAEDIRKISELTGAPVMVIGDLMQAGPAYAERFLDAVGKYHVKNEIALEFFNPPPENVVKKVADSITHFNVELSPESHDPKVREAFGKHYQNREMEESIEALLAAGCRRIDLFFMIGLPYQDHSSVMASVDYCEELLKKFGRRLLPMISPLAPFIDPGSRIFEDPEQWGYRIYYKTLREHREAMLKPSWVLALNYETKWMSRNEIAMTTYHAASRLLEIKVRFGVLENEKAQKIMRNIEMSIELLKKMNGKARSDDALKAEITRMNNANSLCDNHELDWPVRPGIIRFGGLLKLFSKKR